MDHCVFIHTNPKQWLGALLAEYALKRNSAHADRFDVRIINTDDYPFFRQHEGELYLRQGLKRAWDNEDLQSFTPLRFMPPELMDYRGRAVVIDPDVFALADVWELLNRDMQGNALMCRRRSGQKGLDGCLATSVMLLDCAQLTHWKCQEQFESMFRFELDYQDWICLMHEDRSKVGMIEDEWNDFNRLTPQTKMLHTTKRKTQPWKTGLPIDFRPAERFRWYPPKGWLNRARRQVFGEYAFLGKYQPNPDPNQESFFFGLLKECVDQGIISPDLVRREIELKHVRPDAFEVLERTPDLPERGFFPAPANA